MTNGFQQWTDRNWRRLFAWDPPPYKRILYCTSISAIGFGLTSFLVSVTGTYFPLITILTVFTISLLERIRVAFIYAVVLSIACDYFLIPPIGSIFTDSSSFEHFLIICCASIFTAFFVASLRSAFQRTTIAKHEAESAKHDAELARHDAEQASLRMEKVLALVSHDVRTPIGTAKMATQLILENPASAENQTYLVMILRAMERADTLIQSLLDITRIRKGKSFPLHYDHCNLSNQIGFLIEEMSVLHKNRLQFIEGEPLWGDWGVDGIRRALENLITNAIKYGGTEYPVVIELARKNDQAIISVHNQGNEIPGENQTRLFDFYQRGKGSEINSQKGWGLGLALVKGVAEAHGGSVRVESGAGEGTTFFLTLSGRKTRAQMIESENAATH